MAEEASKRGLIAFWRCPECGTHNPSASYVTVCVGCGSSRLVEPGRAVSTASAPPPTSPRLTRFGRISAWITGLYAILILLILGVMWTLGDEWWPATALLFTPRWIWLFPLPVLALGLLAARGARLRLGLTQAVTGLVVAGPLMGFHVPYERWFQGAAEGTTLRIMTLNRHNFGADAGAISDLVERERIDLVCFQEVPRNTIRDPVFLWGWHAASDGSIYSRFPIVAELARSNPESYEEIGIWPVSHTRVVVELPDGRELVVASAHMPTPQAGFRSYLSGDHGRARRYLDWRWKQIGVLAEAMAETRGLPTLLGGDLNTPGDSPLIEILRDQFQVAFDVAGWGYDYTRPSWPRWVGIDHILVSRHFLVRRCRVGPDVGSDHLPMIAEVVLSDPGFAEAPVGP